MAKTKAVVESRREAIRGDLARELEEFLRNPADPDRLLWGEYLRALVDAVPTLDIQLPTVTFDSRLVLNGKQRSAELLTFGGGHTDSDAILYLPEERIAFLGDLLFIDHQPYLGEGEVRELYRTLERVEALDVTTLVPGHGPVGGRGDIERMRTYMRRVEKAVAEAAAPGSDLKPAPSAALEEPFASWKFRLFYQENVETLLRKASASQ